MLTDTNKNNTDKTSTEKIAGGTIQHTPPANMIDGKKQAGMLLDALARNVQDFKQKTGITPALAVVLVGNDPASQVYVRNKIKKTEAAGMRSVAHYLPETTTQERLMQLIQQLNQDKTIHAVLVQLPLPHQMNSHEIICAIVPEKDVDGFHPLNAGLLSTGKSGVVPCTPSGVMKLLASVCPDLTGMHAVILGRSNIVGKPLVHLLSQANCTVSLLHSRTRDIPAHVRQADIMIAAVGKPAMVQADWIKPGAIVIDVGINRITLTNGIQKLVGDVDFDRVKNKAKAITPVPGGVGPMTIACLLENTLNLARKHYERNNSRETSDISKTSYMHAHVHLD